MAKPPLYVDLDGTLIRSDSMQQAFLTLLRDHPLRVPTAVITELTRGRAAAKNYIARYVDLDAEHLPYRADVLEYVRRAKQEGRRVVLATGSHLRYAEAAAKHVGLFDAVFATGEGPNLIGSHKLESIQKDAGDLGFEYLGDSAADLVLFEKSHTAGIVGGRRFKPMTNTAVQVHRLAHLHNNEWPQVVRLLRPHQWVKNVLVFIPAITSHRIFETAVWLPTLLTFVAFCLCASGIYAVNDLFDIDSDRRHPRKRDRPLASGAVTIPRAMLLALLLLIGGIAVGAVAGRVGHAGVLWVVLGYVSLAHIYSVQLKKRLLVDVMAVAAMYSLRPIAGGVATDLFPSQWLLAFCMFFFACIAFAKRYTELQARLEAEPGKPLPGRSYEPRDLDILRVVGPVNGYLAVLVLALYIQSEAVRPLYSKPQLLWLVCPILAYWLTRVWFFAHRGSLHHDPVVFALTDWKSYLAVALTLGLVAVAAVG
ncbi:MAG TPA: UbiA family prenyltransferase [Tepidisphaeraceae bacterium]